nr:F box:WD repeat containing protein 9 [Hymenolepis microstoma]
MIDIFSLPAEIIQRICEHLSIEDVLALSDSSNKLSECINQKAFWLRRLSKGSNSQYSCIPDKRVNWRDVCIARDIIESWFEEDSNSVVNKQCHLYSCYCIDALKILKFPHQHLSVVGDRGGTLSLIALKDYLSQDEPHPLCTNNQAHSGWIWSIACDNDVIATTSWDHGLRVWSICESGFDMISQYSMTSSVLCSDFLKPNLVAVGTMNKEIKIFDYRVPTTTTTAAAFSNTFHTSTVLCLKSPYTITSGSLSDGSLFNSSSSLDFSDANSLTSNMGDVCLNDTPEPTSTDIPPPSQNVAFYSGGKDGILAAWDLRNFNQPLARYKFRSYPRKISLMDNEEMWVAESNRLHVFRTFLSRSTDRSPVFMHLKSHKYSSSLGAISSLEATPGGVFVTLGSRHLDAIYPTMPVRSMLKESLRNSTSSNIYISLSYAQETLLAGGDNGTISVFMSKRRANQLQESGSSA